MTETVEAATAAIPGAGDHNQLYIGGQWVDPHSTATLEVFSPATGVRVGSAPEADATDVDAAVKAARASFDSGVWSSVPPAERADVLDRAAALIEERSAEITALVSAEMGAPAGVVGAITAWNVPLFLVCNKFGAALAAGCSIVIKPAPETPLIANVLAEIMVEAGVPEGVISVVPGGAETGKALVDHPGVDKITFTGSTAAGKAIGASCAQSLKRCSLELGGKSAAIVLDDVDIAAHGYMLAFFGLFNTGQACVAQTRVLVPRSRQDEIVEAMVAAAKTMTVGTPDDPAAQLGPVISERQRQRIEGYIEAGKAAGATAVLDGGRPEGLDNGFFLNPTIFTGVTNDMVIAQEEIFGPVVSVIAYDDVDEAIAIANDSDYGLAGSVWTADVERGIAISEKIRTGTFGVNFYAIDPGSPFGGYKNSGIGRECGPEGLEAFIEHKSTMLPAGYQVPQSS